MEKTLVILKPDCLQRNLVGEMIGRFEKKGLNLVGIKMMKLGESLLSEHYSHHQDKDFFPELKRFMQSSPVIVMVWEGLEAVKVVRVLVGLTQSREALPGTIRGDYSMSTSFNIIHASDSIETAQKEIARFFAKDEIFDYEKSELQHIYSSDERPTIQATGASNRIS